HFFQCGGDGILEFLDIIVKFIFHVPKICTNWFLSFDKSVSRSILMDSSVIFWSNEIISSSDLSLFCSKILRPTALLCRSIFLASSLFAKAASCQFVTFSAHSETAFSFLFHFRHLLAIK